MIPFIALTEVTPMESLTTGVTNALTMVGTMLTTITGNAVLCAVLAFAFVKLATKALKRFLKFGK